MSNAIVNRPVMTEADARAIVTDLGVQSILKGQAKRAVILKDYDFMHMFQAITTKYVRDFKQVRRTCFFYRGEKTSKKDIIRILSTCYSLED